MKVLQNILSGMICAAKSEFTITAIMVLDKIGDAYITHAKNDFLG